VKSHNYLFTVSELRFLQYHVCTIKVFINKRVCDNVTYSTSIGNSFQPSHTCTRSHVDNQRTFVYLKNTSGRLRRHWFKIQHGVARVTPLLCLSSLLQAYWLTKYHEILVKHPGVIHYMYFSGRAALFSVSSGCIIIIISIPKI